MYALKLAVVCLAAAGEAEPGLYWQTASCPLSVAIAQDGAKVAVAEIGGQVELFDLGTKRRLWINENHHKNGSGAPVTKVLFLPGGELLLTGSMDTTIRCFRVSDGEQVWQLSKPIDVRGRFVCAYPGKPQIKDLALAPNAQWVATIGADRVIREWDIRDGSRGEIDQANLGKDYYSADVLEITPDGQYIVGCFSRLDLALFVWRAKGLGEVSKTHKTQVRAMKVFMDADGLWLLAGGRSGARLGLWQLRTSGPDPERPVSRESSMIPLKRMAYGKTLPKGTKIRMPDHCYQERNPASFVREFSHSEAAAQQWVVSAVDLSADRRLMLTAGSNIHRNFLTASDRFSGKAETVEANWQKLQADPGRGNVCLWDFASGKLLASYGDGGSAVLDAKFTPDGQYIISAHRDRMMKVWPVPSETQRLARLAALPEAQIAVSVSSEEPTVVPEIASVPPPVPYAPR